MVVGIIVGLLIWQFVTLIVYLVTKENEEIALGFSMFVAWGLAILIFSILKVFQKIILNLTTQALLQNIETKKIGHCNYDEAKNYFQTIEKEEVKYDLVHWEDLKDLYSVNLWKKKNRATFYPSQGSSFLCPRDVWKNYPKLKKKELYKK